jgi:hypothetical protein
MIQALAIIGCVALVILVIGAIALGIAWRMKDSPLGRMDIDRL